MAYREQIAGLNSDLVKLELKASPDFAAQLDAKLKLKIKELLAHDAAKPKVIEQPSNLTESEQATYSIYPRPPSPWGGERMI